MTLYMSARQYKAQCISTSSKGDMNDKATSKYDMYQNIGQIIFSLDMDPDTDLGAKFSISRRVFQFCAYKT